MHPERSHCGPILLGGPCHETAILQVQRCFSGSRRSLRASSEALLCLGRAGALPDLKRVISMEVGLLRLFHEISASRRVFNKARV